jgi:hypothetical protein
MGKQVIVRAAGQLGYVDAHLIKPENSRICPRRVKGQNEW